MEKLKKLSLIFSLNWFLQAGVYFQIQEKYLQKIEKVEVEGLLTVIILAVTWKLI